jgi:hypothetical protein
LVFGLAFIFAFMTYQDLDSFFHWLVVFIGFAVWGDLLDLWVLVFMLVIYFFKTYFTLKNRGFDAL